MSDGKNTNAGGRAALWVAAFAALAVFYRLVPYLFDLGIEARFAWNFIPVGAVGLFAGARWRSRLAVFTPVAVMLVSDLLLWPFLAAKGYPTFSWMTPIIYGSFAAYALLGRLIRGSSSPLRIGGAAILGALQFYLVTNFACWAGGDGVAYAKSLAGLGYCYYMALPFFRATLCSDLGFSGLFFGLYALSLRVVHAEKASQPA
jgi:hypothetical protein